MKCSFEPTPNVAPLKGILETSVNINRIIWVTSLKEEEKGSSNRITEDIIVYFKQINLSATFFELESASDFYRISRWVCDSSTQGVGSIIHLDMHGSREHGLHVARSDEYVPWPSVGKNLRMINEITKNKLCIIASVCFGYHLIRNLTILEISPFYCLIAPESEIFSGYIEDNIVLFYKTLFESGDIVTAYEQHLGDRVSMFLSERMFITTFIRYIQKHCLGRSGKKRKENLLTEAIKKLGVNDLEGLRKLRNNIKKSIDPNQDLLNKYSKIFLAKEMNQVDIRELIKIASENKGAM